MQTQYSIYAPTDEGTENSSVPGNLKSRDGGEVKSTDAGGNSAPVQSPRLSDLEEYLSGQRDLLNLEESARLDLTGMTRMVQKSAQKDTAPEEILKLCVQTAASLIEVDPNYDELAALLLRQIHYRRLLSREAGKPGFEREYRERFVWNLHRGLKNGILDHRLGNFDARRLSEELKPERDGNIRYIGCETLNERYLLRDGDDVLESIQAFWMRVAMGLSIREDEPERRAVEFYHIISTLRFIPSTPTLFHSGLSHPQLSSCYLSTVQDDLSHIFKVMGDNAALSKWSGGIGNDWTPVRGTGALIKSTRVQSQGVIPFLRIANDVTVAINRSGKRRGASCAYLETWHYDIEDFLDLKRNTGDDRRRTPDMNTANWIPDLFMKRVENAQHWTLFSPDETPELHELYGSEFRKKYEEYEKAASRGEIRLFKQIDAEKLWRKMLTRLFETGHPWITFKDPSNIRSPQDHDGVIHNSNLCTEITLNNGPDETAVCNLGSINLAIHTDEKTGLDTAAVGETVTAAVRMLDNVIDINFYPTDEAAASNLRHRPVGLGVLGFQDSLFIQNLGFHDSAAIEFADSSMEVISWHAIRASALLAAERGCYESFPGSKWDRGILPQDSIEILEKERGVPVDVPRGGRLDWSEPRELIRRHGMRNSNLMAVAPTATISNIAGTYPCIEPAYKNLYVKSNMSGEFTVINRYLFNELRSLGLWDKEMRELLKYYEGSIQQITRIPLYIRRRYLEAFEIDPGVLLECTARRSKWIDQSQSHNVFMRGSSGKKLDALYRLAWRKGLKTTYYLRTLGVSGIEKSTLDAGTYGYTQKRRETEVASPGSDICSLLDPDCEACQ